VNLSSVSFAFIAVMTALSFHSHYHLYNDGLV